MGWREISLRKLGRMSAGMHLRPRYHLRILLMFIFLVVLTVWISTQTTRILPAKDLKPLKGQLEGIRLDGCYHVYLDVGSNVGIQVRKLFEPEKYPEAAVLPLFDAFFGNVTQRRSRDKVCVIGFEPNSHHTKALNQIKESYRRCGWRVDFMVETAVSDRYGTTKFYSDFNFGNKEWGGSIVHDENKSVAAEDDYKLATMVRLADVIKMVGRRKIPETPTDVLLQPPPRVLMKMDIERSEITVLPDLIFSGSLQYINGAMIEFHERLEEETHRILAHKQLMDVMSSLSSFSQNMLQSDGRFDFQMMEVDDESYFTSNISFPRC